MNSYKKMFFLSLTEDNTFLYINKNKVKNITKIIILKTNF